MKLRAVGKLDTHRHLWHEGEPGAGWVQLAKFQTGRGIGGQDSIHSRSVTFSGLVTTDVITLLVARGCVGLGLV